MSHAELADLILSTRPDRPCTKDPACLYTEGHTSDCTSVLIGQHVARMITGAYKEAYRQRLSAIIQITRARWTDELVQEGTSPLLQVGWVSRGAETWHRDKFCKRDRAMGQQSPKLYLEGVSKNGKVRPCAGCAKFSDYETKQANRDWRRLKEATRAATEGLCWVATWADCGKDVKEGWTVCAEHENAVTPGCREGRHEECDGVLAVNTRPDGSTYTTSCPCQRCDCRAKAMKAGRIRY